MNVEENNQHHHQPLQQHIQETVEQKVIILPRQLQDTILETKAILHHLDLQQLTNPNER